MKRVEELYEGDRPREKLKAKGPKALKNHELSRRHLVRSNVRIGSAEDVYNQLREYADRKQEYFLSLTLDGAGHLIEKRVVTVGTLNQSLVHPENFSPTPSPTVPPASSWPTTTIFRF